jgi:hypothetical protein
MSGSQRDDRQFRRGVVLGLTFAEILLLLLFLLMFILAGRLVVLRRGYELEKSRSAQAEHVADVLRPVLKQIHGSKPFDITKEWVRMHDALAKADDELDKDKPLVDLAQQARNAAPQSKPRDIAQDITDKAKLGERFVRDATAMFPKLGRDEAIAKYEEYAKDGKLMFDDPNPASDGAKKATICHGQLETCKAQNGALTAQLNGTLPPCWIGPDGKIQYIYDAHLRENGIVIADNHVPGREADQENLSVRGFVYGVPMDVGPFVTAGLPLLAYGRKNDCRFYVRVYDETRTQSKVRYKQLLAGVEDVFYKLLMQ